MKNKEQLSKLANESYLVLQERGISNTQSLHLLGFADGYANGWKESAAQDYSFAYELQKQIDECEVVASALLIARGYGCIEVSRTRGKQEGLQTALALIFPEYKSRRVFLLNEEKQRKDIRDLAKQYEDEDHDRCIRKERGQ